MVWFVVGFPYFSFKFVRQLFQPFQSEQFVAQGHLTSVLGFLQSVPRLLQGVETDAFGRDEAGLPQSGQLRIGGKKEGLDFTSLLVPVGGIYFEIGKL